MLTTTEAFMHAASAGLKRWRQSRTSLKMQSSPVVMEKIGHSARCFADSSGMTEFTPRRCTEWLQKFSARKMLKTRFAFDESV